MSEQSELVRWACMIPLSMADDESHVAAYWRQQAHADGFLTEGEPKVLIMEPENLGTPEEPYYPFGDEKLAVAEGSARKAPAEPLPTFVPSEESVTRAAKAMFAATSSFSTRSWDDVPAHQRNFYMRAALAAINAAGPHLIADGCQYAADHAREFGLDTVGLAQAARTVRERA